MLDRFPEADSYCVTLFGSLAMTGIGNGIDRIIKETFERLPGDVILD